MAKNRAYLPLWQRDGVYTKDGRKWCNKCGGAGTVTNKRTGDTEQCNRCKGNGELTNGRKKV